jgi:hypothetical protein
MSTTKKAAQTREAMGRKILELEAQLVHVYHFADQALVKAGNAHMMGSGVILQLTALGGREICKPVCIRDGLSDATIAALRADLARSFNAAAAFKPKGGAE